MSKYLVGRFCSFIFLASLLIYTFYIPCGCLELERYHHLNQNGDQFNFSLISSMKAGLAVLALMNCCFSLQLWIRNPFSNECKAPLLPFIMCFCYNGLLANIQQAIR